MRIVHYCNRIIEYSFYALFFLVPLAFASDTFELFEFNKMWLTFGLTIIIAASWFIKMIIKKQVFIQRTPLDIPIILFLLSQVISTIFSWDMHISFWGYYSRFNGGLLSIAAYIFLYYAFISNFIKDTNESTHERRESIHENRENKFRENRFRDVRKDISDFSEISATKMVKRLLLVSLISGTVVALWGLPSHFGYDPTCLIFRGTLDVSCWTADFQPTVRIFSTLGQPDWLAAYLAILLPISIIMFIKSIKNLPLSTFYLLLSTLFYLALLYTRARSGVLATWVSLAFFFAVYFWIQKKEIFSGGARSRFARQISNSLVVFVVLVFITFFAGQPFTQLEKFTFDGIKTSLFKPRATSHEPRANLPAPQRFATEFGGTDSGKIRKIVWQGAIDAWHHYPIFGTGVETFAFAYYRFKPQAHNLTSEWNFLYNKAHNEYLNYLATTGAVGLGTYLLMIGVFLFLSFKYLNSKFEYRNSKQYQNSNDKNTKRFEPLKFEHSNLFRASDFGFRILSLALLASYISILITNFFGFSVVITNIYLFMIPAFVFILGSMLQPKKQFVFPKSESVRQLTDRVSLYQWTFIFFIILASFFMLLNLFRYWIADRAYALGNNLDKAGEYREAYPHLQKAVEMRGGEPVFKDELAINNAVLAGALLTQEDAKTSTDSAMLASNLGENAIALSNLITSKYPNNVVFWKSRVRVFYSLGQVDSRYLNNALEAIKKAKELAPTDANISYNLGVLYGQNNDVKKGIETLENTIRLKPDYRDAYYALGLFYHDQAVDENGNVVDRDRLEKAISKLEFILNNLGAEDKAAKETLEQWKKL